MHRLLSGPPDRRGAFTLPELLLALMMATVILAGLAVVYLAVAGQAEAETGNLDRDLRRLEILRPLRADLRQAEGSGDFLLLPPETPSDFPSLEFTTMVAGLEPAWPGRPHLARVVWSVEGEGPDLVRTVHPRLARLRDDPGPAREVIARGVRAWTAEAGGPGGEWTPVWADADRGLPRALRLEIDLDRGPALRLATPIPAGGPPVRPGDAEADDAP